MQAASTGTQAPCWAQGKPYPPQSQCVTLFPTWPPRLLSPGRLHHCGPYAWWACSLQVMLSPALLHLNQPPRHKAAKWTLDAGAPPTHICLVVELT